MAFVRPQRPAVPPAPNAGNYWGKYDGATDLPNIAAAEFQLPDLQLGDVAWVDTPAGLHVCTTATIGAAVWSPILAAGSTIILQVLTNVQRDALTGVATGTLIFNSDDIFPNVFDGTDWRDMSGNIT